MFKVIGKTIAMYIFVLFITRIMGKREVGQLSPFDLVVAVMIADLASLPLEEKKITLVDGIVPIAVLAAAEILTAFISLKSDTARRVISGSPSILVENGRIIESNLRKSRYNLDDLLAQLREKDIPNIADVEYAILETSGDLSVIPKSQKRPVTPQDLGIPTSYEGLPFPLVTDGQIQYKNLERLNLSVKWLEDRLHKHGVDKIDEVLLASLDGEGNLYVSLKESKVIDKTQLG
ncbi:MAG: DUF421 domain-containing protein [Firmicutes bacterium]|nr:DUF421 domain-containing protein [Bacillota bacterium]